MRRRDRVTAKTIQILIAAVDNAEAVTPRADHAATEVPRRALGGDDLRSILAAEVADFRAAADEYTRLGLHDEAGRFRRQAGIASSYAKRLP